MTDPAPQPFLPFARPSITEREKRAVLEVLDSTADIVRRTGNERDSAFERLSA